MTHSTETQPEIVQDYMNALTRLEQVMAENRTGDALLIKSQHSPWANYIHQEYIVDVLNRVRALDHTYHLPIISYVPGPAIDPIKGTVDSRVEPNLDTLPDLIQILNSTSDLLEGNMEPNDYINLSTTAYGHRNLGLQILGSFIIALCVAACVACILATALMPLSLPIFAAAVAITTIVTATAGFGIYQGTNYINQGCVDVDGLAHAISSAGEQATEHRENELIYFFKQSEPSAPSADSYKVTAGPMNQNGEYPTRTMFFSSHHGEHVDPATINPPEPSFS